METVEKLRKLLLPVLGFDSVEEVLPENSLVKDLGADSIDFVEIIYQIEQDFGVVIKTSEIIVAGVNSENLFEDGRLTAKGAGMICEQLPDSEPRYKEGMTKIELFSNITVRDLARIIEIKKKEGAGNA